MTPNEMKEGAARAAQLATAGVLDLLTIVNFGDGHPARRDAQEAEGHLLKAAKSTMEIAGFDPDERERGELYRAIVNYLGEGGE